MLYVDICIYLFVRMYMYYSYFDKHNSKMSIWHNAQSLPLWLSIFADVLFQIQRNFQWWSKIQWIKSFHKLDGAIDANRSENAKYCPSRKLHDFQMVIIMSRTYLISKKQVSNECWKLGNVFFKDIWCFWFFKIEKINLFLGSNLKQNKKNIVHFLTNEHPMDHLASELRKKL